MSKAGPKEQQRAALRQRSVAPKAAPKAIPKALKASATPRAKGGRTIAPPGECQYCDARRALVRTSIANRRAEAKRKA